MSAENTKSPLWKVRKRLLSQISETEEEQDRVDRESFRWRQLDEVILDLKKRLHTLEFMIYNGAHDE